LMAVFPLLLRNGRYVVDKAGPAPRGDLEEIYEACVEARHPSPRPRGGVRLGTSSRISEERASSLPLVLAN
jgi:hypothetical protein